MPRLDDYKNARKLATAKLATESFKSILRRTGIDACGINQFRVAFLNRVYCIGFPELEFKDEAEPEKEVPIKEQIRQLGILS